MIMLRAVGAAPTVQRAQLLEALSFGALWYEWCVDGTWHLPSGRRRTRREMAPHVVRVPASVPLQPWWAAAPA